MIKHNFEVIQTTCPKLQCHIIKCFFRKFHFLESVIQIINVPLFPKYFGFHSKLSPWIRRLIEIAASDSINWINNQMTNSYSEYTYWFKVFF